MSNIQDDAASITQVLFHRLDPTCFTSIGYRIRDNGAAPVISVVFSGAAGDDDIEAVAEYFRECNISKYEMFRGSSEVLSLEKRT